MNLVDLKLIWLPLKLFNMHQVYAYTVIAIWVLDSVIGQISTHCKSGLHNDGMELAENGALTNCREMELLRNGSMEVLKFKVNQTWLKSKNPYLKIAFNVDTAKDFNVINDLARLTKQINIPITGSYMDIIVHTDPSRTLINDSVQQETYEGRKIYQQSTQVVRNSSGFANFAVYLFPTTDRPVRVNLSAGLKDASIKLGEPRNVTLSPLFPLVLKYIHDEKEMKRVRLHVKRSSHDVKNITSDCNMVSVQGLNEVVNNLEDDKTSKNPWQTMLGQSVIAVNVGG